jgi:hypothetical protein
MPDSSRSQSMTFSTLLGDREFGQHRSCHRMLGFLAQSMGLVALVAIATYIGPNPRLGRDLAPRSRTSLRFLTRFLRRRVAAMEAAVTATNLRLPAAHCPT